MSKDLKFEIIVDSAGAVKNIKKVQEEVKEAESTLKKFGSNINTSLGAIQSVGQKATSALKGIGVAMAGVGVASLKTYADFEVLEKGMETLIGSTEGATKHLQDLQRFASSTPFSYKGLIEASQLMQGFGFEVQEVIPMLKNVGNGLSALGKLTQSELMNVVDALGKVKAKGKVSLEELNRLMERGLISIKDLAEAFGVTGDEMAKMISNGEVSAQEFFEVFNKVMGEKFPDAMENAMNTMQGKISNIGDAIQTVLKEIGEKLNESFIGDFLTSVRDKFSALAEAISKDGATIGSAINEVFGPKTTDALKAVVAGLGAVAVAGAIAGAVALAFVSPWVLAGAGIVLAIGGVVSAIVYYWEEIKAVTAIVKDAFLAFVNYLVEGFNNVVANVAIFISDFVKGFMELPGALFETGKAIITGLLDGLKSAWNTVTTWVTNSMNWIKDKVKGIFGINSPSKVFEDIGINIDKGLAIGLREGVDGVMNSLGTMTTSVMAGAENAGGNTNTFNNTYNITTSAQSNTDMRYLAEQISYYQRIYNRGRGING